MKTIITGATGFVGKNLSVYLQQKGIEVLPLSLRSHDWQIEMQQDAQAIIHLAGKAHDTAQTSVPELYFQINRDLTITLFKQFLQSNIKDFIYFSSVKAIADTLTEPLTEAHTAQPLTPYGQSKWEAEQYLMSQTLPEGKRLLIIRPCMIHGPGNKGNLNLLYQVVKKGIPWPLVAFQNQRSFLSIDNLQFIIESLLQNSTAPSGAYQVADDEIISTNELVSIIAQTLGKNARFWSISAPLITWFAKVGDYLHLPLNSERLKKLTESYVVSNTKIKKALGITQLPMRAQEGLKKTIQSFLK